ncbi:MAG: LPS export ABC transporter permease LptF [Burkholderiales bacterium]|nr:LPS export ABC transporter permease LptF [Burkholderiales bacterium]
MLFDATLRRELSRGFGATLVVLMTIVVTMFLIRMLGLAANGVADPADVALLLAYTVLGHLPTMLSLSLFIAVVVTLGRMYRDSEMAIWFASGVGLSRFVRPVLRTATPVLLTVGVGVLVVWPWSNQRIAEMRERYEQRSDISRVAPGSFQSSRDGSRVFFIEREGESAGVGRNVFVLSRDGEREAVTTARAGRVEQRGESRELVLDAGHRNERDQRNGAQTVTSFDSYRMQIDAARAAAAQSRPPKATGSLALWNQDARTAQGELTWRLSMLFGACNLALLGVGTSATNPRRASNWNLLFALLAFVVYYNLVNLSQAWVSSGRTSMAGALLGLHGTVLALAVGLIWWRDHAATIGLSPRRAGAST